MKPVSELLSKRHAGSSTLYHVKPDDMVFDALKLLADYEVGALMVMERGQLVGIFSERDYTRKIALQNRSSKDTNTSHHRSRYLAASRPCGRPDRGRAGRALLPITL